MNKQSSINLTQMHYGMRGRINSQPGNAAAEMIEAEGIFSVLLHLYDRE